MNPVLVEVTRGDALGNEQVESIHRGAACVVDIDGKVVHAWGDVEAITCPRSAVKPMQNLPLIEAGAADAFHLSEEELALACASHSGEPTHTERVAAWQKRVGLSVDDLECGAHPPTHIPSYETLIREGQRPCPLHNNCSGKHSGFLCLAMHMGAGTKGYVSPTHAVQRAALMAVSDMANVDLNAMPLVRDGCNAPNVFMPLRNLALAWARFGAPDKLATVRKTANKKLLHAMKAQPYLFSGTDRPCKIITENLHGAGVAKVGAEGVFAACIPEQGLGIAVKIDDGAARAASVAITSILKKLGALKDTKAVSNLLTVPHKAWAGPETGVVRAAAFT
ncbi:MAG: asparaginase [Rhodospirillaceae bacterium]|nr:asparaginase [Rhodospirillaceae bacterium]